jgi:hypothetical protein
MSFVAPKGLLEFFKGVGHGRSDGTQFATQFDKYYLCLLAGLDVRRLGQPTELESDEFIRAYPQDYSAQADILAGLLIDAELDRQAISATDRESVQQEMLRLLDHNSPTRLSDTGAQLLNRYAAGGLAILRDRLPSPQSLADFLSAYVQLWHPPKDMNA